MSDFSFLQDMLNDAVAQGVFPAAVAAVGAKNRTLCACAAGSATPNTRFDLASMTKVVSTTMLALCAVEKGLITLGDTLGRFFAAPPDKADITIFQLLTHTGGFEPSFRLERQPEPPEEAAACILRMPLAAVPDGTPRYSCTGFILLGKILEQVYGLSLDVAARKHVFSPLGMHDTTYCPVGSDIAPTEINPDTGEAICGVVHDENARFLGGVSGNAGVFSDLHDCTRFASMLAQGGLSFLSLATLAKAIQNYTPGHDVHRGLGFHLAGTPGNFIGDLFPDGAYGHTGFTGTSFAVDPGTGFFAVLLTNRVHPTRENEQILRFRRVFHNRVYAAYTKMVRE